MSDADHILSALGELHRTEREQLTALDAEASSLAAQEPGRASALQARLISELFPASARPVTSAKPKRIAAAVSCAMAAAIMLWLTHMPNAPQITTSYTLLPPSPDASLRSAAAQSGPAAQSPYSLGRVLSFRLRPAARHSGALRVECYAAGSGKIMRVTPRVEQDAAGGIRVELSTGPRSALPIAAGSWELLFYVAPETAPAVSVEKVRARACPQNMRCLSFAATFIDSQPL